MSFARYGATFNDWTNAYHSHGRERGGTEWLEDQLTVLQLAIENAKQLDIHYNKPEPATDRWNYNGR